MYEAPQLTEVGDLQSLTLEVKIDSPVDDGITYMDPAGNLHALAGLS